MESKILHNQAPLDVIVCNPTIAEKVCFQKGHRCKHFCYHVVILCFLTTKEKLISGASPLMHVAREMTDPHGLGSLIGQVPCGKRCAKKFLGCVEYLEALQEPPRTGCLARFTSSTAFAITAPG